MTQKLYGTKLTFQDIQRSEYEPTAGPATDALMEFPGLAPSPCPASYPIRVAGEGDIDICRDAPEGSPFCFCKNLVQYGECPKGCREG